MQLLTLSGIIITRPCISKRFNLFRCWLLYFESKITPKCFYAFGKSFSLRKLAGFKDNIKDLAVSLHATWRIRLLNKLNEVST